MTRTARASSPQALFKDRSVPRNGRDKSIKKNGGGAHGWGNIKDEATLEDEALDDERREYEEEQKELEQEQESGNIEGGEEKIQGRPRRASTLGEVKGTFHNQAVEWIHLQLTATRSRATVAFPSPAILESALAEMTS
ncbi:hypothetical protein PIIN_03101 [Serendipita indica DSM 11827]|uniref:Hyaluronan/mRNA-binding protein domain-containing protein n=1 Tax=Serendipita indica (strain DSM 11827) TaxID=1109443 RepID=G4TD03_SERID|nr:hypothetical protein PIIN_03101 [Serendipita indica DSM 11827]